MTGIYKIESPSGKIYIGQSWNIENRWKAHRYIHGRSKLINSIKSYGIDSHQFSVIHCLPSDVDQIILDSYEQLYMDLYSNTGSVLLNLRDAGSHGKHSTETRKIISAKGKGRTISIEQRKRISELHSGHTYNNGRILTDSHRHLISKSLTGRIITPEHRKKISDANKGANNYLFGGNPGNHPQAKKIIDVVSLKKFNTIKEAAKEVGLKRNTLSMMLTGKNKNSTNLRYDS